MWVTVDGGLFFAAGALFGSLLAVAVTLVLVRVLRRDDD